LKIKMHKYLKELEEAERRGYEKGRHETEERLWKSQRLEDNERDAREFRARILKTLEEHERKLMEISAEPVRCENAAVCFGAD
jgi:hypothetical protein